MTVADRLRFTILGCGSSGGVPRIGGDWGACDPRDTRNRRRRCSLLVERLNADGRATNVLVDAGPDLRSQCLDAGIQRLDAVLITHEHADHIHGLDELRVLFLRNGRQKIPVWTAPGTADVLRKRFGYAFAAVQGSGYDPFLSLHLINGPIEIHGPGGSLPAISYAVPHGALNSLGFRFGPVGYTPDLSGMSDSAWKTLEGVEAWIVDALQRQPHPTHTHLNQTLSWIERLAPSRAVLTNMHVHLDYEQVDGETADYISPAFDGMILEYLFESLDPPAY